MKPERILALVADAVLIVGPGAAMLLQIWVHRHDGKIDGALIVTLAGILTARLGVGVWLLRPTGGDATGGSPLPSTPSSPVPPADSPSSRSS